MSLFFGIIMNIDILSAGPSALDYRATGNKIIAINSAALIHSADWVVMLDTTLIISIYGSVMGNPVLVTSGNAAKHLDGDTHITSKYCKLSRKYRPYNFSIIAAQYFAYFELMATSVTIYGDDKVGTLDCMDTPNTFRNDIRWQREIKCQQLFDEYRKINK